jgi:hypothetical protein
VRAARALAWPLMRAEIHAVDATGAKVRLLRCNQGQELCDLEEAWRGCKVFCVREAIGEEDL